MPLVELLEEPVGRMLQGQPELREVETQPLEMIPLSVEKEKVEQ